MNRATLQTAESNCLQALSGGEIPSREENSRVQEGMPSLIRVSFRSKQGLEIEFTELLGTTFESLVDMYDRFEPKRAAQGLPPTGRDRIFIWLQHLQKNGSNLVALHEGRVIGHTMLCPVNPSRAEFAIFIDQDYRDQGIGTRFTELTMELARSRGYGRIWLSVEVNNLRAIRVYKKLGFQLRDLYGPEQEMEISL